MLVAISGKQKLQYFKFVLYICIGSISVVKICIWQECSYSWPMEPINLQIGLILISLTWCPYASHTRYRCFSWSSYASVQVYFTTPGLILISLTWCPYASHARYRCFSWSSCASVQVYFTTPVLISIAGCQFFRLSLSIWEYVSMFDMAPGYVWQGTWKPRETCSHQAWGQSAAAQRFGFATHWSALPGSTEFAEICLWGGSKAEESVAYRTSRLWRARIPNSKGVTIYHWPIWTSWRSKRRTT